MRDLRRDALALCCALSAGIHAGLTPAHLDENVAAGLGFAASAVLLAWLAIGLARRPDVILVDASIVVLTGLLIAYALAVTTGVPGLVPEPEPIDWFALVTKAVEVLGLALALSLRWTSLPRFRPIPVALVMVVVTSSALLAIAVERAQGGHQHSDTHNHHHHTG